MEPDTGHLASLKSRLSASELRRGALEYELEWYRDEALRQFQLPGESPPRFEPCSFSLDVEVPPFVPNMRADRESVPPLSGPRADCEVNTRALVNTSAPVDMSTTPTQPSIYEVHENWKPHLMDMGFDEYRVDCVVSDCSSLDQAFLLLESGAYSQHSDADNEVAEPASIPRFQNPVAEPAADIPSFQQIQREQEQAQEQAIVTLRVPRFEEIQKEQQEQSQQQIDGTLSQQLQLQETEQLLTPEPHSNAQPVSSTAAAKTSQKEQRQQRIHLNYGQRSQLTSGCGVFGWTLKDELLSLQMTRLDNLNRDTETLRCNLEENEVSDNAQQISAVGCPAEPLSLDLNSYSEFDEEAREFLSRSISDDQLSDILRSYQLQKQDIINPSAWIIATAMKMKNLNSYSEFDEEAREFLIRSISDDQLSDILRSYQLQKQDIINPSAWIIATAMKMKKKEITSLKQDAMHNPWHLAADEDGDLKVGPDQEDFLQLKALSDEQLIPTFEQIQQEQAQAQAQARYAENIVSLTNCKLSRRFRQWRDVSVLLNENLQILYCWDLAWERARYLLLGSAWNKWRAGPQQKLQGELLNTQKLLEEEACTSQGSTDAARRQLILPEDSTKQSPEDTLSAVARLVSQLTEQQEQQDAQSLSPDAAQMAMSKVSAARVGLNSARQLLQDSQECLQTAQANCGKAALVRDNAFSVWNQASNDIKNREKHHARLDRKAHELSVKIENDSKSLEDKVSCLEKLVHSKAQSEMERDTKALYIFHRLSAFQKENGSRCTCANCQHEGGASIVCYESCASNPHHQRSKDITELTAHLETKWEESSIEEREEWEESVSEGMQEIWEMKDGRNMQKKLKKQTKMILQLKERIAKTTAELDQVRSDCTDAADVQSMHGATTEDFCAAEDSLKEASTEHERCKGLLQDLDQEVEAKRQAVHAVHELLTMHQGRLNQISITKDKMIQRRAEKQSVKEAILQLEDSYSYWSVPAPKGQPLRIDFSDKPWEVTLMRESVQQLFLLQNVVQRKLFFRALQQLAEGAEYCGRNDLDIERISSDTAADFSVNVVRGIRRENEIFIVSEAAIEWSTRKHINRFVQVIRVWGVHTSLSPCVASVQKALTSIQTGSTSPLVVGLCQSGTINNVPNFKRFSGAANEAPFRSIPPSDQISGQSAINILASHQCTNELVSAALAYAERNAPCSSSTETALRQHPVSSDPFHTQMPTHLPLKPGEHECLIGKPLPLLLVGRSGTGKTTSIISKLMEMQSGDESRITVYEYELMYEYEWFERARDFEGHGSHQLAAFCYSKAGKSQQEAHMHGCRLEEEAALVQGSEQRQLLVAAARQYLIASRHATAAKLLVTAKEYTHASEIFKKLGQFDEAESCLVHAR